MSKKRLSDKRVHWQQHIIQQQKSGLSQAEYCRQHALNYKQFCYYFQTFDTESVAPYREEASEDFVPIHIVSQPTATESSVQFTLTHSDGSTLQWVAVWSSSQMIEFITQ